MADDKLLEKVVALSKRRGFIFPGSDLYGGLANTYDLGPRGVELNRNLINLWWKEFVHKRPEVYGLDTAILMSPKVWEASGHTASFSDSLIDCKNCHYRTRADHLIEDKYPDTKVEGKSLEELEAIIQDKHILCPKCGQFDWTSPRLFNQLFETQVGIITGEKNTAYLRGETAQGMFVDFKQVIDSIHPRLPFGLAQAGKVFRNEITMGKFTFRVLEFDLAEFEYFVEEKDWEQWFEFWKEEVTRFAHMLGVTDDKLRWRPHTSDELSHYSKRTEDLEYKYPFGYKEWFAVAYRTNFDLKNHSEKSGVDLSYTDPKTNRKFIPHVIEPTFGITRSLTTILINSYYEDKQKNRVMLKLPYKLAPYQAAVFPLLSNKEDLVNKARQVQTLLYDRFVVDWDDRGNIGKRYYSQDEIGTPFCITVDFDTLEKETVTVRDRDTALQETVSIGKLAKYLDEKLN
ncbi:glycine--tRNA ligase [Candidatus Chazhemtobacterium aquaticus]|uniref:glycine--tRNA ligase n=1 Tax=Candidatus Chazhemtobacterium aquaticus TaxID=2715735 RepID=A0A857N878_9BACT|nr:glycine--tRNA ligase [Candidatus Chazhemtobacterium aquaticus]QHO63533.1 Glycyl-tRNA synthetase [Candidatus Chazhemtobacterium aquaticus]